MESRTRRQVALLVGLLAVLTAVLWWNLPAPPTQPQTTQSRAARPAQGTAGGTEPVEAIRLDALATPRPEPSEGGRDPFRFRPQARPPQGMPDIQPGAGDAAAGPGDGAIAADAGPPPIPLRFIGVMRLPESGRIVAVLSDGNGVYRGSEGDIIEGRYRIVRLGPESVELAHVDGQGHQVIRLSGS